MSSKKDGQLEKLENEIGSVPERGESFLVKIYPALYAKNRLDALMGRLVGDEESQDDPSNGLYPNGPF